jgi:hypothetical protein
VRRTDPARDRETLRRAAIAAGLVWVVAAFALTVFAVLGGELTAVTVPLIVLIALVFAGLAASAWLMLAALLDIRADELPGRRRIVWTGGLLVATAFLPLLAAAFAR